mmetsp:Transcript_19591/g.28184  ORF Transcript_19591/g.28184 Transcript_19591/m.28184 type:complete len:264 (-) Transcript_19591:133-924(-)|eukprot:CAMPEP_0185029150 /NCGR_PEP_ID=MMETSP1103-20130426/15288_1 /TAXON_ID=36769 /ORGANISM="Paraphysomonas bandaiensis, Strain Caron Lab Isolate" /LENGTH=263 /DNA_ID=CAMNT_0027563789 /DNA_START=57 /DNA_END=848 /DNA_ORIENTATION=+
MTKKRRLEDTTIACPIVYGSMSVWMGRKAHEFATHKWTLFVRGPNDEDLSCFVSKIIFSLHPSFEVPVREITEPPYEVTEMGWGEFEAGIRIFFKDSDERPVDILHPIKLYPGGGQQMSVKKPVMHEFYDEIVFTNPTKEFSADLMMYTAPKDRPITRMTEHYTVFDEDSDLQHLSSIHDHITREIESAKARILRIDAEIAHIGMTAPPPTAIQGPTTSRGSSAKQAVSVAPSTDVSGSSASSTKTTKGSSTQNDTKAKAERS